MPYATSDDTQIYFEVRGENGSPLLMIQGFGANIASWSPTLIEQLCSHHQVILFDNRGTGQSAKPQTPYTMAEMARDAVCVLNTLALESAHVCGVSLGGAIAQHVGLDYPQRVRSLILGCTAPSWAGPHAVSPAPEVVEQLLKPASGDRAQDIRDNWRILFPPAFIKSHRDWLEQRLQQTLAVAYPETPEFARQNQAMGSMATHDTYDRLPELLCPTLIQTGAEDILIPPENSRVMAARIPNGRLIEYPGQGHAFFALMEERVVEDMLGFMRSN